MHARLSAVQQALLLLLVASLALAALARPYPQNRRFAEAFDEIAAFRAGYSRTANEQALRQNAENQGALTMAAVASAAAQHGAPPLQVAEGAPVLRPLTLVSLGTLAAVRAHAEVASSTLTVGSPDVDALGAALAWRLTRLAEPGPLTLQAVELVPAAVTADDVKRELSVANLGRAQVAAKSAVDDATRRLEGEERLFEARRKRGLPWKIILQSIDARKAARASLDEKTATLADLQARYESEAKQAESTKPTLATRGVPPIAVARVTLAARAGVRTVEIPVQLALRDVAVPTLRASSFPATRAAGLWDEVKGLDADRALSAVQSHFNWHNRTVEVAGLKVGGPLVLQLLPCALPALLLLLLARIRAVGANYSPFTTKVRGTLPRAGFKSRGIECVALVILPCLAVASAAASLFLIGQAPVLPSVAGLACLFFGGYAFVNLGELRELVESVVLSHSYPPPEREP